MNRVNLLSKGIRGIGLLLTILIFLGNFSFQPVVATTSQRTTAISTMRGMRSVVWAANGDVIIYGETYKASCKYTGMPYTQDKDSTLKDFTSSVYMSWIPGGNYYSFRNPAVAIGNDCSSAVAISWKAGGSAINVSTVDTKQMFSAIKSKTNCMAKEGSYTASSTATYTTDITKNYTTSQLYGSLVAGDACVYRRTDENHAILITSVNVSSKTVSYIEQIGAGEDNVRLNTTYSTWTSGTLTFDQLKSAGYLPLKPTDI